MSKRKPVRTRGKLSLSKYFQEFKEGEAVAFVKEASVISKVSKRIQGLTGVIEGKRGKAYLVKIKDKAKEKRYLIEPIHLKKIKQIQIK